MTYFETGLMILLASAVSALAGLLILRLKPAGTPANSGALPSAEQEGIVYLFEKRSLVDATARARSLLPPSQTGVDDWGRFMSAFGPRFARLESKIADLSPYGSVTIDERQNDPHALSLRAELFKGITRIALIDPRQPEQSEPFERYAVQAMEVELNVLRSVAEDSPILTWRQLDDGTVVWANAAYMAEVAAETGPDDLKKWPPHNLFETCNLAVATQQSDKPHRVSFQSNVTDAPKWFELRAYAGEGTTLFFASAIDELVQAENSLREFIGTLGKTFAQLPTGLAIFDAKRRLVLFNPALIDLTALGAEVLSQRPSLHEFLDALRENQRIPEPRDYKSWRLRIARLEAEATDGRYQETWTLPTGHTYRVTGQPHPDGAVAFLFEDISSEVSLKRRYRSELDISNAVLNAFDHGVAVFTQDGTLSICNSEYKHIWGVDPDQALSRISLDDSLSTWGLDKSDATTATRLRNFVLAGPKREDFKFVFSGPKNQELAVSIRGLPKRATLIEFTEVQLRAAGVPFAKSVSGI